jgi:hypothetical protein
LLLLPAARAAARRISSPSLPMGSPT